MSFVYKDKCPICGNTNKGCRHNNEGLYFCRIAESAPFGYRFVGHDSKGFGMYVDQGDTRTEAQKVEWVARKRREAQTPILEVQKEVTNYTPIDQRNKAYRALPTGLEPHHFESLRKRGLSDRQIELLMCFGVGTWQPNISINVDTTGVAGFDTKTGKTVYRKGFVIPALTIDGQIAGYQIANDNKDFGKYINLSSTDKTKTASWSLPNGEVPLPIWDPQPLTGQKIKEIVITEAYLKSAIYAVNLMDQALTNPKNHKDDGVLVVGAPGSSPIVAPKQLHEILCKYPDAHIRLCPDAGAVMNPNVMRDHRKLYKALEEWGFADRFSVMWWGQLTKWDGAGTKEVMHCDIDELIDYSVIEELNWSEFNSLAPSAEGLDHWIKHRKFTPDITLSADKLIDDKFFDFRAPKDSEILAIKSATGSGKTQWVKRISTQVTIKIGMTPTNNLCLSLAELLDGQLLQDQIVPGQSDLNQSIASGSGVFTLCPDSILYITPDQVRGMHIVIDEALEVYRAFLMRRTAIQDYRHAAISRLADLMAAAASVTLMDGHLTNTCVEWYAALAQNKTITKVLNPNLQAKMTVDIALQPFVSAEDVGSKPGAHSLFLGAIDKRSSFMAVTDSKADSKQLSNYSLDADSCKDSLWAQEAMADPNAWITKAKPNNIALSPVAIQGWDCSVKKAFDRFYGYFCGVVSVDNIRQGLARYRDFEINRTVYIAKKGLSDQSQVDHYSIYSQDVQSNLFKYYADTSALLMGADLESLYELREARLKLQEQIEPDSTHKAFAAEMAAINYERQNLRGCVIWALVESGYEVNTYFLRDREEIRESAAAHRKDKSEAKIIAAIDLRNAPTISDSEANKIEHATRWKPGDKSKLDRHLLIKRLPGIQDSPQWNDEFCEKSSQHPRYAEFITKLPKTATKAEQYYLLNHPEILKRRGQKRYQGFLNAGKVDLAKLKIQYTRINLLINSGLISLISGRQVTYQREAGNVDCVSIRGGAQVSLYIKEDSPDLVKFCTSVSAGKGGEKIARGKRTRIEFLGNILEGFGLKLFERKKDSGEYVIYNPWYDKEGSDQAVTYQAVVRRFEAPEGELAKLKEEFAFTVPNPEPSQSAQDDLEPTSQALDDASIQDIRELWQMADSDEMRESLLQAWSSVPRKELESAIARIA